jgi:2-C-methyl-D-erythritol 2,4-cyclodiphosphate synthase
MRIGFGYDSHRFDEAREMVLGGVVIPGVPGLVGFSDGDAIAHSVTDAILGAACLGDVGSHFPPGDERWRNADSLDLLRRAVSSVRDAGYRVGNVDVTVVCELPRIGPFAGQMREALAGALAVDSGSVSVKGKSNEGMGWEGRRDGLAAYAVALLLPSE